jgi:hypothetical protein
MPSTCFTEALAHPVDWDVSCMVGTNWGANDVSLEIAISLDVAQKLGA